MSDHSSETIKEGMDWVAFNDVMDDVAKRNLLQKLKEVYPKTYNEWCMENKSLIEKWKIPA